MGDMMDGRCATCRHWQIVTESGNVIDEDKPIVWDEEKGKYLFSYKYSQWDSPTEIPGWRPCAIFNRDRENAKLLVYHESDPVIETAPDFGCVQWQAQETS